MRIEKYIYICLAALALAACNKGGQAEGETAFTEYQKKALAAFTGVWLDHAYSNLSEAESAYLLPDPDRLEFGTLYQAEKEFYASDYIHEKTLSFVACGEVVYVDSSYGDPVSVPCYFYVTPDADALYLYRKETEKLFKGGPLEFKSASRILWSLTSKGYAHDFRKN